jgi:SAM-dependent methyltransferase
MSGEQRGNAAPSQPEAPSAAPGSEDLLVTGLHSTRRFYELQAEAYARATLPSQVPDLWSVMEARLPAGSRILDVGAGAGRDLRHLSVHGYHMIGIDLSFPLMRIAKRISRCPTVVGDMRSLPFPSRTFDGVWSIASQLHIARSEIVPTLRAIRDVMKDGGLFLASVREGHGEFVDANGRLFVLYTVQEWREALLESGFQCETCERSVKPSVTGSAEHEQVGWLVSLATA